MSQGDPDPIGRDEELALLKRRLAEAQKMATLGELVSTTTHEFNNVLMTIINYAKMGMRHHDAATRDKSFEKILAASQRAAKITTGILAFARKGGTSMEPTDMQRLVDDALVLLEREMTKYRIKVETKFVPAPEARINRTQIQQVLMNLLVNARQAMPNGGRILVQISHDSTAQTVDVMIRDTGTGIAPDNLRRMFDPYFTTKSGPDASGKGGTGLGLSTCRDIIEAHQGKIRVESTIDVGTAITIKLPVAVTVAAPLTPAVIATPLSAEAARV
ncbi:MAG TPA: ATP-binding protein [Pirellulales bacterium]|jgi:signal transduction histidine kinase|nr:ATP-binding protein [Pirellulales bacterium]